MTAVAAAGRPARSAYFAWTALIMLAAVLASFPLTYYLPLAKGTKSFGALRHIHGVACFAWIALYAWQTWLAARGRIARHREIGLIGLVLTGVMIPLGVAMAVTASHERFARGNPQTADNAWYNLCDIGLFALFMLASVASITRHIEWHRRFTYAAALCLVGPAISRWLLLLPEVFPWTDFSPNVVADLMMLVLLGHDLRARGRVHGATLLCIAIMLPVHIVSPWIGASGWWHATAPGLFGYGPG